MRKLLAEQREVSANRHSLAGFTLIEIVMVLLIATVLVGVSIPELTGLQDEREARKPVFALERMVNDVRGRAMREGRPYQIVFERNGFHATDFFQPDRDRDEFLNRIRQSQLPQQAAGIGTSSVEVTEYAEAEIAADQVSSEGAGGTTDSTADSSVGAGQAKVALPSLHHEKYEIDPGTVSYDLWFWGESQWKQVDHAYFRSWVFQPTGMVNPLKARFLIGEAAFEVHFDSLTGQIKKEMSYVPPKRISSDEE